MCLVFSQFQMKQQFYATIYKSQYYIYHQIHSKSNCSVNFILQCVSSCAINFFTLA